MVVDSHVSAVWVPGLLVCRVLCAVQWRDATMTGGVGRMPYSFDSPPLSINRSETTERAKAEVEIR